MTSLASSLAVPLFALTGWPLTTVLAILGAAGGATLLLYLLKLRRRRIHVPFVGLWEQVLAEKQTTRLFSQLKRWLSFLLALSIVAAMAISLGDPRSEALDEDARTLVVLVDASASMQATDTLPSRFDAAKEHAEALIEGLGPADRLLIAQLDARSAPLSPLSSETRILARALDSLRVTDGEADLRSGLRLALDVLRGKTRPEIVLISDGGFETETGLQALSERIEEAGVRLSYVPIGQRAANVGITAFSVRRYPLDKSQSEVLVELYNPQDRAEDVELELLGDGNAVDVQTLTIPGGERVRRFFRNISGVDQTLEARLRRADQTQDDLPVDDHAFARLPSRRRTRVCVVSEGNLYLQAALLLDEYLDVREFQPSDWPVRDDECEVFIFDGYTPAGTPNAPSLYLNPDENGPLEIIGEIEGPYFDHVRRQHPIFQWMALRDVNMSTANEVRLAQGDRAIARSSDGPLIVTGTREGKRFVATTFNPQTSDLPLRVAWPLFLLNTIDWFVQEEGDYLSSFAVGETWRVPVAPELESVEVLDPSGESREVPVVDGRAVYAGDQTGFYEIRHEGETIDRFAVNLGTVLESEIMPAERLAISETVQAEAPTRGQAGVRKELWLYLILLALAVLVIEWWTFHRRVTV